MKVRTDGPLTPIGPAADEARKLFADLRTLIAQIATNGINLTTKIETPIGSVVVTTDIRL